jgi:hypothetical protein
MYRGGGNTADSCTVTCPSTYGGWGGAERSLEQRPSASNRAGEKERIKGYDTIIDHLHFPFLLRSASLGARLRGCATVVPTAAVLGVSAGKLTLND